MAIAKYDQFDFLIDIVPREDIKPVKREEGQRGNSDQAIFFLIFFSFNVMFGILGTLLFPFSTAASCQSSTEQFKSYYHYN